MISGGKNKMVTIVKNGEYNNVNLKDVQVNEEFEFTLKFDEPKTGQGKYGPWHLFNVTLHQDGETDVSFFAQNRVSNGGKFGAPLGEELCKYGQGTRIKLKKVLLHNTQRNSYHPAYELTVVSEGTKKETTESSGGEYDMLVALLKQNAGGVKKDRAWVEETLKGNSIEDDAIIEEVWNAYNA